MARQLTLSFELICFLEWLAKEGKLRHFVQEFVSKDPLIVMPEYDGLEFNEQLHKAVISFVNEIEDMLFEEFERTQKTSKLTKKNEEFSKDFLKHFLKNWNPSSNEPVN